MEFRIDRLEERIAPSRAMLEKLFAEISQLQADAQSNVANLLSDAHAGAATNGQGQQSAMVQGDSDVTVISESNAGGNQTVVTNDVSTPVVVVNNSGSGVIATTSRSATVVVTNASAAQVTTSGDVSVGSISTPASAGLINPDFQVFNGLFAALTRL